MTNPSNDAYFTFNNTTKDYSWINTNTLLQITNPTPLNDKMVFWNNTSGAYET